MSITCSHCEPVAVVGGAPNFDLKAALVKASFKIPQVIENPVQEFITAGHNIPASLKRNQLEP